MKRETASPYAILTQAAKIRPAKMSAAFISDPGDIDDDDHNQPARNHSCTIRKPFLHYQLNLHVQSIPWSSLKNNLCT